MEKLVITQTSGLHNTITNGNNLDVDNELLIEILQSIMDLTP